MPNHFEEFLRAFEKSWKCWILECNYALTCMRACLCMYVFARRMYIYLANIIVLGQVLFWSACTYVSDCLCVRFFFRLSQKVWPILIKFGRMLYHDKIRVTFKDGLNSSSRAHTSPIWKFEIVIFHKVLYWFLWNSVWWCKTGYDIFISIMKGIPLVWRKNRPFEILKLTYFLIYRANSFKLHKWNVLSFSGLLWTCKKSHWKKTYLKQLLRAEVTANLIYRLYELCPFNTFALLLLPLFITKEMNCIGYPRFWTKRRAKFVFYWTLQILAVLNIDLPSSESSVRRTYMLNGWATR